jgi:tetratricopeptide (TPR) repeat protein
MRKIIFYLFAFLIFFVPIVLWPYTSEVFEFNKVVLVYLLTTLIAAAWTIRCIIERKFVFRRTILDIPLLIFFGSQLISTILSIDFRTSVFGYYSRFNGGLLSTVCYLLLYWAFVSNFEKSDTLKLIKVWFASAVLVSFYGVLEHFGIDKNIWVQDVQSRVFSSLGQPNWLATWVTALIPVAWAFTLNSKFKSFGFWIYFGLSILFFWTLIFTKSRSGFLGFGVACVIFWSAVAWQNIKKLPTLIPSLLIVGFAFIAVCLISGTQLTPSLISMLKRQPTVNNQQSTVALADTALETGGTESGVIRKIVWNGALQVWLHYPLFGTGTETFAFSYYLYRPAAHNLTSEWNFIYNKAHNEFLNIAANTGTMGLLSYLTLIVFSIVQISKSKFLISKQIPNPKLGNSKNYLGQLEQLGISNLSFALLAGFMSLSVSNFFGFSVVPTQLEFFLFPALAIALTKSEEEKTKSAISINTAQKVAFGALLLLTSYFLLLTCRYWYADTLYNQGENMNSVSRPDLAIPALSQAIKLTPWQAIYYGELANSYAIVAMASDQAKDTTHAAEFANLAIESVRNAVNMAPANVNLRRTMFGVYVRLSTINEKYLINAGDTVAATIKLAPTDAKLYYNLGIVDANLGQYQAADTSFQKAIELKANYGDARIEYAALLVHLKRNDEAKVQLNYILTNIDPNNTTAKQALENLK